MPPALSGRIAVSPRAGLALAAAPGEAVSVVARSDEPHAAQSNSRDTAR